MRLLRALPIVTLVLMAGCTGILETNEQACVRLLSYGRECASGGLLDGPTEAIEAFCSTMPENNSCRLSAYTNCVIRHVDCDDLAESAFEVVLCADLLDFEECAIPGADADPF